VEGRCECCGTEEEVTSPCPVCCREACAGCADHQGCVLCAEEEGGKGEVEYSSMPKIRPVRPSAEMEDRIRELLYENAKTIDEFEQELGRFGRQRVPKWLGALLVVQGFLIVGLLYALVRRWMS